LISDDVVVVIVVRPLLIFQVKTYTRGAYDEKRLVYHNRTRFYIFCEIN